jgi:hypothetical protein
MQEGRQLCLSIEIIIEELSESLIIHVDCSQSVASLSCRLFKLPVRRI